MLLGTLTKIIKTALLEGHDVLLRGIGEFKNSYYSGGWGRHPRTGEPLRIPPKRRVMFYPSRRLKWDIKESAQYFREDDISARRWGIEDYHSIPLPLIKERKKRSTLERKMDKYAVEIDPEKVLKEKKASSKSKEMDPDSNIPLDPDLGSEPYEKEPKWQKRKQKKLK
jgi:nucleoid DNA-binding protein